MSNVTVPSLRPNDRIRVGGDVRRIREIKHLAGSVGATVMFEPLQDAPHTHSETYLNTVGFMKLEA